MPAKHRSSLLRAALGLWALSLCLACLGCSIRAQPLRSQPLVHDQSTRLTEQTEASFLIYPFEDLRGNEFGYIYPTTFIPVVNFFHIGNRIEYAETSGILRASQGGRPMATVGSLDAAFPHMLANMMREMRFTSNATPLEQVNSKVDLGRFDYVISGQLTRTQFKTHVNIIPLAILGYLGAPFVFVSYELGYKLTVLRPGDTANPVWQEDYSFEDSAVVGLYYGQSAYFDLFIASLEKTLPKVIADIAAAVRKDSASRPAAAPAADPAPPPAKDPKGDKKPGAKTL